MIDKREQSPPLPVMVLLESDVNELADAEVYLDPGNPDAPLAVDLLLGTQGWRRFAFLNAKQFTEKTEQNLIALPGQKSRLATRFDCDPVEEGFEMFADGAEMDMAMPDEAAPGRGPDDPAINENAPHNNHADDAKDHNDEQEEHAGEALEMERELPELKEEVEGRLQQRMEQNNKIAGIAADEEFADGDMMFEAQLGGRGRWSNDFTAVRIYAHQVRSGRQPGERTDFAETLFWHAGIKTDDKGKAGFEFGLNDAVTSFRILAEGVSKSGSLGSSTLDIDSVEPFYVEPLLPLEVTAGDQIRLPIGIVNATMSEMSGVSLNVETGEPLTISGTPEVFSMAAGSRQRQLLDVAVGSHNGEVEFSLAARAGDYADNVTRTLTIRPQGFPIADGRGGLISNATVETHEVIIPNDIVPGSLTAHIKVYPTPLASLTEALEGLIREPCGCFEQTSSTIYPLIMAQQYFKSHQGVDPELVQRSSAILDTGYDRLTAFECKNSGYEWFGADPGHDALTAYGLMEFTDMSTVRQIDASMLNRTREWLLNQRNGKGGFKRETQTLHTWLAEPEIANSYNTWALLEAGVETDLSTEINWIRDAASKSSNTYVIALGANVMLSAGDKDAADPLLDKLSGLQQDNGSITGATQSVVGSGGDALAIETTALAVQAWLQNERYSYNVERSIKFLAESCKSGRFGSTQSTVLALRAIVAYDKSRARPEAAGSLVLVVDGKQVGDTIAFDTDTHGSIDLPEIADRLDIGTHSVELKMEDGSEMPYSIALEYNRTNPDSAPDCVVNVEVALVDDALEEGSTTEANVTVTSSAKEDVPNPVAIIGIPGGLEVRHDQLKELVTAGKIAAYEVRGREVVLYWRVLEPGQKVDLPLSLLAAVPGTYSGPASRTYLYYTDELKHWAAPVKVEITPKS